jgi:opacity protein-like surface antigen
VRPLELALLLTAVASPVFAQQTEVTLLGGYRTAGNIDETTRGISELKIKGSFTFGAEVRRFFSDHLGAAASYSQQSTALEIGTSSGSANLFDMELGTLQGHLVYRFTGPQADLQPFLCVGAGAAFLSATDLQDETKFAWSIGGGIAYSASHVLGLRAQARYSPTHLNGSTSTSCAPFGFCQGTLNQIEVLGGVSVRF